MDASPNAVRFCKVALIDGHRHAVERIYINKLLADIHIREGFFVYNSIVINKRCAIPNHDFDPIPINKAYLEKIFPGDVAPQTAETHIENIDAAFHAFLGFGHIPDDQFLNIFNIQRGADFFKIDFTRRQLRAGVCVNIPAMEGK